MKQARWLEKKQSGWKRRSMAGKQEEWPGNKESGWESRRVVGNRRLAGNQGEWLETGDWLGIKESGWKRGDWLENMEIGLGNKQCN